MTLNKSNRVFNVLPWKGPWSKSWHVRSLQNQIGKACLIPTSSHYCEVPNPNGYGIYGQCHPENPLVVRFKWVCLKMMGKLPKK